MMLYDKQVQLMITTFLSKILFINSSDQIQSSFQPAGINNLSTSTPFSPKRTGGTAGRQFIPITCPSVEHFRDISASFPNILVLRLLLL
jgi:hypothetical protein